MIEEMRQEEHDRQTASRAGRTARTATQDSSEEGYLSYMQRQIQERTERLGMTSDSMNRLEDSSSGFAEDVSKFVKNQKRKAVLGGKFDLDILTKQQRELD
jgi:hypothetical protein